MNRVVTVDIGGSTVRWTTADESGVDVAGVRTHTTDEIDSATDLAETIAADLEGDLDAVGVAAAGVVDRDRKRIVTSTNWEGWELGPLGEELGVPLALENDADASALGLREYGDIEDGADLAYLTISTGIGVGILRNGRLVPGVEAGFATVDWDGDVTHGGIRDPWEGYAAGARLPDRIAAWLEAEDRETALSEPDDAAAFFDAVYDEDRIARDYYTRLKRINAAGLGTIVDVFQVDTVVFGGGVASNHPSLLDYGDDPYALEPIDLADYCVTGEPEEVRPHRFEDDLELYGGAAAALTEVGG